ncbi:MAG: hypothetical protein WCF20_09110 [Methylovirgula sp.]
MCITSKSHADVGQQPTPEEQFFAILSLSRLMVERGVTPIPEFDLLRFDATALLFAHSAGRLTLPPTILSAAIRTSRDEDFQPNRKMRRAIEARARDLLRDSAAILREVRPLNSKKGGAQ